MMTRGEFAQPYIVAIYLTKRSNPDFRPKVRDLIKAYDLPRDPYLESELVETLINHGWINASNIDTSYDNLPLDISFQGKSAAESKLSSGFVLEKISSVSVAPSTEKHDSVVESFLNSFDIDSATWTGIAERVARSPRIVSDISICISEIDNLIGDLVLSNLERARLKAITTSLQTLVESPEPEWKAIVALLQSPTLNAVLGLAGIIQLTLKLIFGIG